MVLSFPATATLAEVVVVVSLESSVQRLSRADLADIYLGKLDRFPNGDPATPIDQKESTASHDSFYTSYLGRSPAQVKAHWSKLIFTGRGQPPRAASNGEAMADLVAGNPEAIGYLDRSFVNDRLRIVEIE